MDRPAPVAAPRRHNGFTLIELIVTVAVFAVISLVVFSGLGSTMTTAERSRDEGERLAEIQRAVARMDRDFGEVAPRPVRNAFGDREPALRWDQGQLWVTSGGRANYLERERSTLYRVGYAMDDDESGLLRLTHEALDQSIGAEPTERLLLDGIESLVFRFHDGQGWIDEWPPMDGAGDSIGDAVPAAIAVRIELEDHGSIERSYRLR